jgi:hypothetical protein
LNQHLGFGPETKTKALHFSFAKHLTLHRCGDFDFIEEISALLQLAWTATK